MITFIKKNREKKYNSTNEEKLKSSLKVLVLKMYANLIIFQNIIHDI